MKGKSEPGAVHLSGDAWTLINRERLQMANAFEWDPRETQVKGLGLMDTYLLPGVPDADFSGLTRALVQLHQVDRARDR